MADPLPFRRAERPFIAAGLHLQVPATILGGTSTWGAGMARRLRSIGIALAWVCTVCGAQAAPCDAPALLNDGWQAEADPAAAGFDAGHLCAVLRKFADSDANFHSLLVVRHGRLVAEVYRAGKDERVKDLFRTTRTFDASTLHDIRSISKSVTSLLWGIAQGQGKTPPLDTPRVSFALSRGSTRIEWMPGLS